MSLSYHGHVSRFLNLLESYSAVRSLDTTKRLHALSITTGNHSIFINNNIISSYVSFNAFLQARKVFDELPHRTLVSYNTLITAYGRRGDVNNGLNLFNHLRVYGFVPNQRTFTGLLCCEALNLFQGFLLFGLSIKNGVFASDAFVGTTLLGLFGRIRCFNEAFSVFDEIPHKSLVTWNAMLVLLASNGFVEEAKVLFRDLLGLRISVSEGSFVAVFSGLGSQEDLSYAEGLHCLMTKCGVDCDMTAVNSLIGVYVRSKALFSAERLFEQVSVQNDVAWTMIIDAMVKCGRPQMGLEMFVNMSKRGFMLSQATFVAVIGSCIALRNSVCGKSVHAKVIRSGFESDVIVGTALVDFYSKCDNLISAHDCFDQIEKKNVLSWNALILGYSNIDSIKSILLFKEMLQLGCYPSEYSFYAVLKSSSVSNLHQLHGLVIRMGYENHEYVLSSLAMVYTRNGLINEALLFVQEFNYPLSVIPSNIIAAIYNRTCQYNETIKLLSLLQSPDVVSWNIVILACARSGYYNVVFEIFKHMSSACICPDKYTFMSLLSVCTKLCGLDLGRSLHGFILKTNSFDTFLGNVLLDMYGKCGNIESSLKIFNEITERNIITWTALISTLGLNGYAHEAVKTFHSIVSIGLKPDALALRAVLSSCSYSGLVREGMEIFEKMETIYGIQPELDHYHCIVDLLAKNGQMKEAKKVIASMPFQPNVSIWRSFLDGYTRMEIAV